MRPALLLLLCACGIGRPVPPPAPAAEELLAGALPFATELALTTDRVWWLEPAGSIGAQLVSLDKRSLVRTTVVVEPACRMLLAPSGDTLYFTACAELRRTRGGAPERLATLAEAPQALTAGGGAVFWAGDSGFHELSPEGVEVAAHAFDGLRYGVSLAADATHVWFVRRFEGELMRLQRSDGAIELVSSMAADSGPVLCADDAQVYWGLNGYLEAVDKGTLKPRRLDAKYSSAVDCAAESGAMFWASSTEGAVMQLQATASTAWVSGQQRPLHVAAEATHVYWVTAGTQTGDGQLLRRAR